MSGGSYDYAYSKINDLADLIKVKNNPLRVAFVEHLRLIAQAVHDIEWVDSDDSCEGNENKSIQEVLRNTGSDPDIIAKAKAFDEISKWFISHD